MLTLGVRMSAGQAKVVPLACRSNPLEPPTPHASPPTTPRPDPARGELRRDGAEGDVPLGADVVEDGGEVPREGLGEVACL